MTRSGSNAAIAVMRNSGLRVVSFDGHVILSVSARAVPNGRAVSPALARSCGDGRFYLVTQANCNCEDTRHHPGLVCKHASPSLIHIARVAGTPMPAGDTIDGLAQMVDRHPVLEM